MSEWKTIDLEDLRRKAEAATPGPWVERDKSVRDARDDNLATADSWFNVTFYEEEDAAYIAAANPTVILSLLDRIKRLEEALHRCVERFSEYGNDYAAKAKFCRLIEHWERAERVAAMANRIFEEAKFARAAPEQKPPSPLDPKP